MDSAPLYLEKNLEYIGVSKLRNLNAGELRSLDHPLAVMPHYLQTPQKPLAVLIGYQQYINIQELVIWVMRLDLEALIRHSGMECPTLDRLGVEAGKPSGEVG